MKTEASAARRSKTILGAGEVSGGEYGRFRIYGAGEVHGKLRVAGVFKSRGACELQGDLAADRASLWGAVEVQGGLQARRLFTAGAVDVQGPIEGKSARLFGAVECRGGHLNVLRARGAFHSRHGIEAERVRLRGAFQVDGLLNADRIDLLLHGPCRVQEIGGGRLRVTYARSWFPRARRQEPELTVDSINVDDVYLEGTTVQTVAAVRARIGPDCRIRSLTCRQLLGVDPASAIEEVHWTGGRE